MRQPAASSQQPAASKQVCRGFTPWDSRPPSGERRHPTGFTLVEVMIVAALFLIVAGALLTTFLTGRTSYLSSDAFVLVQQEARRAFDVMVRELRKARLDPASLPPIPPTTTNQLNFQVALSYTAPDINWGSEAGAGNPWIHYAVIGSAAAPNNDRQLVRCVNALNSAPVTGAADCPGGFRVLANYVNVVNFAYNPDPLRVVTVNLSITYSNPALPTGRLSTGTPATPTLTTSVKLRNP